MSATALLPFVCERAAPAHIATSLPTSAIGRQDLLEASDEAQLQGRSGSSRFMVPSSPGASLAGHRARPGPDRGRSGGSATRTASCCGSEHGAEEAADAHPPDALSLRELLSSFRRSPRVFTPCRAAPRRDAIGRVELREGQGPRRGPAARPRSAVKEVRLAEASPMVEQGGAATYRRRSSRGGRLQGGVTARPATWPPQDVGLRACAPGSTKTQPDHQRPSRAWT